MATNSNLRRALYDLLRRIVRVLSPLRIHFVVLILVSMLAGTGQVKESLPSAPPLLPAITSLLFFTTFMFTAVRLLRVTHQVRAGPAIFILGVAVAGSFFMPVYGPYIVAVCVGFLAGVAIRTYIYTAFSTHSIPINTHPAGATLAAAVTILAFYLSRRAKPGFIYLLIAFVWTLWAPEICFILGSRYSSMCGVRAPPAWVASRPAAVIWLLVRTGRVIRMYLQVRSSWQILVTAVLFPLLILFFALPNPIIARYLGLPGLIAIGSSCWLLILAEIQMLSAHYRLPLITAVLVWGTLLSIVSWNPVHAIRQVSLRANNAPNTHPLRTVTELFDAWLRSRPDLSSYDGYPYPVLLVAAEGGGIRAAYNTAMLLAELEDHNPGLRTHIFAMSGVSGGAVGAALFSAICRLDDASRMAEKNGHHASYSELVSGVMESDYVSPVIASLIGPELIQRILPIRFLPGVAFDRAAILEVALESAFNTVTKTEALEEDLGSTFDVGCSAPLLVFNTTDAYSGKRVVLSPAILPGRGQSIYPLQESAAPVLRVSTAAVLSARFPLVSPAGRLRVPDEGDLYLVDGGFVDNTGGEGLQDILDGLSNALGNFRFGVLAVRFKEKRIPDREGADNVSKPQKSRWVGNFETLPIISALYTAHAALTSSDDALKERLNHVSRNGPALYLPMTIAPSVPEPLSWSLSDKARQALHERITRLSHLHGRYVPARQVYSWPPDRFDVHDAYVRHVEEDLRKTKEIAQMLNGWAPLPRSGKLMPDWYWDLARGWIDVGSESQMLGEFLYFPRIMPFSADVPPCVSVAMHTLQIAREAVAETELGQGFIDWGRGLGPTVTYFWGPVYRANQLEDDDDGTVVYDHGRGYSDQVTYLEYALDMARRSDFRVPQRVEGLRDTHPLTTAGSQDIDKSCYEKFVMIRGLYDSVQQCLKEVHRPDAEKVREMVAVERSQLDAMIKVRWPEGVH